MDGITVRVSSAAARALMNSPQMQAILLDRAEKIRAAAGDGFEADVQPGRNRAHAMVKSTDYRSRERQATDNVLLKAIGASR